MARQNLTPQQILFQILRARNNLYDRTEGIVGPELVRHAKRYVNRVQRQYAAIEHDISERDRRLIKEDINYWNSLSTTQIMEQTLQLLRTKGWKLELPEDRYLGKLGTIVRGDERYSVYTKPQDGMGADILYVDRLHGTVEKDLDEEVITVFRGVLTELEREAENR